MSERDNLKHYARLVSQIIFSVYFFFIVFGTSIPFRARPLALEDYSSSNVVNQIVFSSLFLISVPCLVVFWRETIAFLKKEKWLFLLLVWATLSVGWSDFSTYSFKRLFQVYTNITVCLAFFAALGSSRDMFRFLRPILSVYLVLNILSVLLIPGATDPTHGTWRGLAVGKNMFGQAMVICFIFMFFSAKKSTGTRRLIDYFLCFIAVVLLVGSHSGTSIGTFLIVVALGMLYYSNRLFRSLNIGRMYVYFILLSFIAFAVVICTLSFDWIESMFLAAGKDLTFTGRTNLWIDIWNLSKQHFWLGCGYNGFWIMTPHNHALMAFLDNYEWVPNEAHMGYLDILNELGMVGLFIFILLVLGYFVRIPGTAADEFHFWLIIAILILNLQESTLFRANLFSGVFFIMSYMAACVDMIGNSPPSMAD